MQGATIKCVRCQGRKKLFKINSGYSYINSGGFEVECPMCLGKGVTPSLIEALEEIKKTNKKHKERDFENDKQKEE